MMEEFDDAQNVGELLRNTRLKKGKTLVITLGMKFKYFRWD